MNCRQLWRQAKDPKFAQKVQKIFNVDREEFVAWLRGKPKQVAVPPPPPPNRATKTFIATVPSRDVVVLPAAMFSTPRDHYFKPK